MRKQADAKGWVAERAQAERKAAEIAAQKVASAAVSNATRAERIKEKLLMRLEAEIDNLPASIGTEMDQTISSYTYESEGRKNGGGSRIKSRSDGGKRYKLRDLTSAYRDLVADMPKTEQGVDDPLLAVLKRWDDAAGITGKS